jgi:peptidoglycan/xylan/chitin deacetylase (PgdA/CDA1 family)
VKRATFLLLRALGITRAVAWTTRRQVKILCYHGVTEARKPPGDPHDMQVHVDRLEAHLDHLRRRYRVISLREYLDAVRAGVALPPRTVVITFDDGYRNLLTVAAPVLARHGLPASIFIVTQWVDASAGNGGERRWLAEDDTSFLSWSDVRVLASFENLEVGSHTHTHAELPTVAPVAAEDELRRSLDTIRSKVGADVMPLAYPKGRYADWVVDLARETGYTCGLTTDGGGNGPAPDVFRLRRTLIGDEEEAAFAARVAGLGWWLSRLQAAVRGRARPQRSSASR